LLQQYVPLFLTKEDLDVAVGGAYRQRNASQISAVKEKAALYEEEYQAAMREVGMFRAGAVTASWNLTGPIRALSCNHC
jgi:hypothetical protein